MNKFTALLASTFLLTSCASVTAPSEQEVASAAVRSSSGSPIGTIKIVATAEGLTLTGDLNGLPPGVHGMHLHMSGACDGPGFTTAGGHLNPQQHQHGTLNPMGSHMGDLPNITVAPDGTASIRAALSGSTQKLKQQLFDADGTSIVIHAGADDYKTDPSGNSGPRIACGIFKEG
jgi:Cu-Zn family superoxide dismutase